MLLTTNSMYVCMLEHSVYMWVSNLCANAAWHTKLVSVLMVLLKKTPKPEYKQLTDFVLSLMLETSFKYIFPTVFQLISDKQKLIGSYK